ncbi:hypothetical protein HOLleu_37466 [Holothuria leucospilota]|uniref:GST N-terminal domain-containing protein n=1 Tax=Holothuria leucospilota TaxID=206669 RepID=A0A9Q0YHE3_HOLLE|nr:hypothetical protein HOLleu_37466 [Holothuria leucospilota]
MANYKLIYFDFKGRVEPDRYMFELAGVKYEDKRYGTTDEAWVNDLKPYFLFLCWVSAKGGKGGDLSPPFQKKNYFLDNSPF